MAVKDSLNQKSKLLLERHMPRPAPQVTLTMTKPYSHNTKQGALLYQNPRDFNHNYDLKKRNASSLNDYTNRKELNAVSAITSASYIGRTPCLLNVQIRPYSIEE